jgi:hypothetical protein
MGLEIDKVTACCYGHLRETEPMDLEIDKGTACLPLSPGTSPPFEKLIHLYETPEDQTLVGWDTTALLTI